MAGFIINIEEATLQNDNYRRVLYTAYWGQLIVMSLLPKEEIGVQVLDFDQFIRFELGCGKVILDGEEQDFGGVWAVVIPAGVEHNVINTSHSEKLKFFSISAPPEYPEGTVHPTKADDPAHYLKLSRCEG
jgi:mannose-6-phosphate isomerase-like protein (cupin superfamily)